jgi:4-hydroxy-tetrahydrodipicolinate synthase
MGDSNGSSGRSAPTLEGILAAIITPLSPDASTVKVDALRALVERCLDAGITGFVPCGSTGEFPTLTLDERRLVAETVVDAVAGRVPTIVGTGTVSTRDAIALSRHAQSIGAAGVMIVPPYYEPLAWPALLAHYAAVAEQISIPIMYYNNPAATGLELTIEQFAELKRSAGVAWVKDTGGNAVTEAELHRAPEAPTLLHGMDSLGFAALADGVRGFVWGAASFMPSLCVNLHRLLIEELDLAGARELWDRLLPICHFLDTHGYTSSVKAACNLVGIDAGPVRAPLPMLDAGELAELQGLLEAAGHPALAH